MLSVRVIHCVKLKMSVLQVFYENTMTVISHLVGAEQLPGKEQVGHDEASLVVHEGNPLVIPLQRESNAELRLSLNVSMDKFANKESSGR